MTDNARPDEEIVRIGRLLYDRRLIVAAEGNLSVRLGVDRFLTTPAGRRKGDLSAADLVEVGLDGEWSGASRPSSEWRLHAAVYRVRPDVGAIVHAHPPYATAHAVARRPLIGALLPEAVLVLGGDVPLTPYAMPGTPEVGEGVARLARDHQAVLLANHGAVAFGHDLEDAYRRMETVERLAEVSVLAAGLGGGVRLTLQEIRRLRGL